MTDSSDTVLDVTDTPIEISRDMWQDVLDRLERLEGTRTPDLISEAHLVKPNAKRGTRLPTGYVPPAEVIQAMQDEFPDVERAHWELQHRAFCDYWIAVPGARGCKLDWEATWRNWIRREFGKPQYRRRASATTGAVSRVDEKVMEFEGMRER